MLNLYAKAALYSPSKPLSFDSVPLLSDSKSSRCISLDITNINKYNSLVAWDKSVGSLLHPNYIQVLSLPMQLEMMVKPSFPFKAMGLVHVANSIQVNRLPLAYGEIDIQTRFGSLYHHRKGVVFEVMTKAIQDGETCIDAVSYYLARISSKELDKFTLEMPPFAESLFMSTTELADDQNNYIDVSEFNFSHGAGREYAKVSGDYNPIHLWPLTASIFGFKRAIVHGMCSKALAFSALYYLDRARLSKGGFSLSTVFKAPISLPKKTLLQKSSNGRFCIASSKDDKSRQHLFGEIITRTNKIHTAKINTL